jgi:hypothetical protein
VAPAGFVAPWKVEKVGGSGKKEVRNIYHDQSQGRVMENSPKLIIMREYSDNRAIEGVYRSQRECRSKTTGSHPKRQRQSPDSVSLLGLTNNA